MESVCSLAQWKAAIKSSSTTQNSKDINSCTLAKNLTSATSARNVSLSISICGHTSVPILERSPIYARLRSATSDSLSHRTLPRMKRHTSTETLRTLKKKISQTNLMNNRRKVRSSLDQSLSLFVRVDPRLSVNRSFWLRKCLQIDLF
jgi:hypothetical protein